MLSPLPSQFTQSPRSSQPASVLLLKSRTVDIVAGRAQDTRREETPTLVFARWAGYSGGRALPAGSLERRHHIYSTSIPPEKPLKVGMRVRILATSPAWYANPEEDPESYDTYDAHVVGVVTGVAGWKERKIVLQIRNECALNTVESVRLRVPFVPEVTVQLEEGTVPVGQREAQESDLNTQAVVRARVGDARCGGSTCWLPWRRLVGESFLWEPMTDDVAERPGIKPGRKRIPREHFAAWGEAAVAEIDGF